MSENELAGEIPVPKQDVTAAPEPEVSSPKVTAGTSSTQYWNMYSYVSYGTDYFGIARASSRQVDTSGIVPTVDRMRIGADQAGNYLGGIIKQIQFWL